MFFIPEKAKLFSKNVREVFIIFRKFCEGANYLIVVFFFNPSGPIFTLGVKCLKCFQMVLTKVIS